MRVIVYSVIIIDINADRLNQTRQCLRRTSDVHERKEKVNRRRLLLYLPGPALPLTLLEAKNCEPVYSLPLDYRTVNLQCLVLLTVDDSYRSQQLVALAPCHIRAKAVCVGDGLSLYSFSTWNSHAIITI